jgi:predicted choloylglycine hydrolase
VRVLDARGTPYEIGHRIGAAAPDLVGRTVELVCRFELSREELARRLAPVERRLRERLPRVLEEAEGLAEGAGIDRRDALVLSVASDLHGRLPGWCSLGAVPGGAGVLVGKNLDTSPEMADVQVVERLVPEGGLAYVHVTAAGAMWTDGGVNEAGLALVNSSLAAAEPDPEGLPDGIVARELLARCETVAAAVELAERHGFMTLGENILVADAAGDAAVIEKLPGAQSVRRGEALVACNHPLAARLDRLMSASDAIRQNSEGRLAHLDGAAHSRSRWTVEDLASVLRDHEGGVCQHGADGLWTVASLIASPSERRLWAAGGPPCKTEFGEIRISHDANTEEVGDAR